MDHRAAFQCTQCPQNNDPARGRSCPTWWEWTAEHLGTGESRIVKQCGWTAMPIFFTEVIKASNRPAAAVESTRNEIATGLAEVGRRISSGFARIRHTGGVEPAPVPALPQADALPALDRLEP